MSDDRARDAQLRDSTSDLLAMVFRAHNRAYVGACKELGITTLHAHILVTLWLRGPMRIGALQRALSLSSSTFSGAVDRMAKLGLLRRVRDPEDGRAWLLEPADWPADRRAALEDALIETEAALFAPLSEREHRTFKKLLRKLLAS